MIGGANAEPPSRCDIAVVGGGIVGLAVARELSMRLQRLSVCVLERDAELGLHQTGRNSGVIHAGIYYAPGSLKAKLCIEGARLLYEYCDLHSVRYERCGKLVLATHRSELERLAELQRRALANGVAGVRRVERDELGALEPHATGIAALHSPGTGMTDFRALAAALAADVIAAGGTIHTGCELQRAVSRSRSLALRHSRGVTETRHAIFCAGAWSDRLAVACGASPDPRIVPFRGAYLRLAAERRHLVRSLVYPVPDPSLPFLGVHLTRTIGGEVLVGPTALLAGARDAYEPRRVSYRDVKDTLMWPGSWRMARRWWRTAVSEARYAAQRSSLVRAVARYVPELTAEDLEPAFAGIRAQALSRAGRLIDDFAFSATFRALHVRNAPSPAATSSLAIAQHIASEAQRTFDLHA